MRSLQRMRALLLSLMEQHRYTGILEAHEIRQCRDKYNVILRILNVDKKRGGCTGLTQ